MQLSFEPIIGFQLGIDYVSDIDTPENNITVDLLRISLGIIFIHIAIIKDAN